MCARVCRRVHPRSRFDVGAVVGVLWAVSCEFVQNGPSVVLLLVRTSSYRASAFLDVSSCVLFLFSASGWCFCRGVGATGSSSVVWSDRLVHRPYYVVLLPMCGWRVFATTQTCALGTYQGQLGASACSVRS